MTAVATSSSTPMSSVPRPRSIGVVSVRGAAAAAGIRAGDIIVSVAGQPTESVTALQAALALHKPGDRVPVRLARNGSTSTVTVTLGSLTS